MTSPKPRSVFSAICRSNGIILGRMRATVGSRFPQNASRASASLFQSVAPLSSGCGNWIAACLPGQRRLLTARIERTQSQRALLAVSAFTKRGRAWFSNLGRCQTTTGKCFFLLNSLLKFRQEPFCSVFKAFEFSPIWGQVHLSQSAGASGLVAHSDGHRVGERKRSCPTRDGSNPTRNGAIAS